MWQRPVSGKVSVMFVNQNTKNTVSKYLEPIFVAQWQLHTAVLSTRTIRGMVRFHFCFTNEITKQCYACCFMYRDNFVPHRGFAFLHQVENAKKFDYFHDCCSDFSLNANCFKGQNKYSCQVKTKTTSLLPSKPLNCKK